MVSEGNRFSRDGWFSERGDYIIKSVPSSVCWKISMLCKIGKIKNINQFQKMEIQFIIMRNIKSTKNKIKGSMVW